MRADEAERFGWGVPAIYVSTLRKLAAAHGLSIDDYLSELAKRSRSRRARKSAQPAGSRRERAT